MLSLPQAVRILLCTRHADLRKSFDGLAQLVREFLGADPLSGHLFVFLNKRGDRLKLLYWDADGYVIFYKRLEEGTFKLPTANVARAKAGEHGVVLRPAELTMLLDGIDLANIKRRKRYERPATTPVAEATSAQ
jgi:transposase